MLRGNAEAEDPWRLPGLKIAMFHRIGRPAVLGGLRGLSFSKEGLDAFLRRVTEADIKCIRGGLPLHAAGGLVVTFDDGFASLMPNALPVLLKWRCQATVYLLADMLGKYNSWDPDGARYRLMDRAEIRDWIDAGQRIGSHGLTHRALTTLSPEEARREILDSRNCLSDLFGVAVDDFCYPYGAFSPEIATMVKEAGYKTAVTTRPGVNDPGSCCPFTLRRVAVGHQRPWLASIVPGFLSPFA